MDLAPDAISNPTVISEINVNLPRKIGKIQEIKKIEII